MAKGPGLKGFDAGTDNVSQRLFPATAQYVGAAGQAADAAAAQGNYPAAAAHVIRGALTAPIAMTGDALNLGAEGAASVISPVASFLGGLAGVGARPAAAPAAAVAPAAAPSAPTSLDAAAGGQAPAVKTQVDPNMGPFMPQQVAGKLSSAFGTPVDSHQLGITDPGIHNVEDFVAHNSHLTPLDIQILQGGKMSPHDQMIKSLHEANTNSRELALQAAEQEADPAKKLLLQQNAWKAFQQATEKAVIPQLAGAYTPGLMQQQMLDQAEANKRGLPK